MTDTATELPEMSCQELVEVITAYLERALSDEDHRRFEEHLDACRWCRQYLGQFEAVIAAAGRLREEDISPAAREELLTAFRDWKR